MTPSSTSQMRHHGTGGRTQEPPAPLARAQALLGDTVLLQVEDPGYPVLIAGHGFAGAFPSARPGASFLSLVEPDSRGRLVAALDCVAKRRQSVTLTCVRQGRDGPRWIEIALEPLLVAPGGPARVLGRLTSGERGPAAARLQVLALRPTGSGSPVGADGAMRRAGGPPWLRVVGANRGAVRNGSV